jgi:hypothetical protein
MEREETATEEKEWVLEASLALDGGDCPLYPRRSDWGSNPDGVWYRWPHRVHRQFYINEMDYSSLFYTMDHTQLTIKAKIIEVWKLKEANTVQFVKKKEKRRKIKFINFGREEGSLIF